MAKIAYFDTETTGIDPKKDRIVSLAIVLMDEGFPAFAKEYFFNPGMSVPPEAVAVHGLTDEFLAQQPTFAEQLPQIHEDWIQAAEHVAHNAKFDVKMLSAETARALNSDAGVLRHPIHFTTVTDTLAIANKLYPSASVTLDRLCDILGVDRSGRTLHGALLDCELLAQVHVKLVEELERRRAAAAELLGLPDLSGIAKLPLAERAMIFSRVKGWMAQFEELEETIKASVKEEVPESTEQPGYEVDLRKSTKTAWEKVARKHIPDIESLDLSEFQSGSTSLYFTWKPVVEAPAEA